MLEYLVLLFLQKVLCVIVEVRVRIEFSRCKAEEETIEGGDKVTSLYRVQL